uniref:Ligand-gated ion channel 4-like n=1 Tax=Saccoglossus kowalevskii TaxID=10224 RepID=A0ABM0LVD9_SACKO|nr:PREDICTED: ligand-gated ion channel 4-like [Saccoglossus kowalevskii]
MTPKTVTTLGILNAHHYSYILTVPSNKLTVELSDNDDHIIDDPGDNDDHIIEYPGDIDDHNIDDPDDNDDHNIDDPNDNDDHNIDDPGDNDDHNIADPSDNDDHNIDDPGDNDDHNIDDSGDNDDHNIDDSDDNDDHNIDDPGDNDDHNIHDSDDNDDHNIDDPDDNDDHNIDDSDDNDDHNIDDPGNNDDHNIDNPDDNDDHNIDDPGDNDNHIIDDPGDNDDLIIEYPGDNDDHNINDPGDNDDHIIDDPGDNDDHNIDDSGDNDDTILMILDVRNQILSASLWIYQEWTDRRLQWDPLEFGNQSSLVVNLRRIWYPDTALYKSADLQRQQYPKVSDPTITCRIFSTGNILAVTPGIYKLPCPMNMEHFPFDRQFCSIKFGTWAYVESEVDLVLMFEEIMIENYISNREWTIINSTAGKVRETYQEIDSAFPIAYFNMTLARKPMYYVINLVVPCMMLSVLTIVVFYLPPDCGEKVSLSISILLAFHVFNLLVTDIMPPTSSQIPMISRYLLFNMTLVALSVIFTAFVLNIQRGPVSKRPVPKWVRTVFVKIAPKFLCMHPKPTKKSDTLISNSSRTDSDVEKLASLLRRRRKDHEHRTVEKRRDVRSHGGKAIWVPRTNLNKHVRQESVPLKHYTEDANNINASNYSHRDSPRFETSDFSENNTPRRRSHRPRSQQLSSFEHHVSDSLQVILNNMQEKQVEESVGFLFVQSK